ALDWLGIDKWQKLTFQNPYREVSNQVLDMNSMIEMAICTKAIDGLTKNGPGHPDYDAGSERLRQLVSETKNMMVVHAAHSAVLAHRIKL
ncbi:MAG: hypothetical protein HQ596_02805, partial [Candidatus Saganbacteria bacterium]|nr:hypothetical protein [Candidatus Saganbacteria bacterium]